MNEPVISSPFPSKPIRDSAATPFLLSFESSVP